MAKPKHVEPKFQLLSRVKINKPNNQYHEYEAYVEHTTYWNDIPEYSLWILDKDGTIINNCSWYMETILTASGTVDYAEAVKAVRVYQSNHPTSDDDDWSPR